MDLKQQSGKKRATTRSTDSKPEADQLSINTKGLLDGQPPVKEQPLRILLTGLTGSGKSATGNTLLGEKRFAVKKSPESVTRTCQLEKGYNAGRAVQILDTPGLFDTQLSDETIATCILKSETHLAPGPHIVVLTININFTFDNKSKHAFERLKMFLGESVLGHFVIVFTNVDQLDEGDSIDDFVLASPALKALVDECGQRYVALNNRSNNKQQVESFFNVAEGQVGKIPLKIRKQNSDEIAKQVEEADKREVSKRPDVAKLERITANEVEARLKAEDERKHAEKKAVAEMVEKQRAEKKAKREAETRQLAEERYWVEIALRRRAEKKAKREAETRQLAEERYWVEIALRRRAEKKAKREAETRQLAEERYWVEIALRRRAEEKAKREEEARKLRKKRAGVIMAQKRRAEEKAKREEEETRRRVESQMRHAIDELQRARKAEEATSRGVENQMRQAIEETQRAQTPESRRIAKIEELEEKKKNDDNKRIVFRVIERAAKVGALGCSYFAIPGGNAVCTAISMVSGIIDEATRD